MQKTRKPQIVWFMYLVIESKLIYYDLISILNKTPKCVAISGKMRKANENSLAGGLWFFLNT